MVGETSEVACELVRTLISFDMVGSYDFVSSRRTWLWPTTANGDEVSMDFGYAGRSSSLYKDFSSLLPNFVFLFSLWTKNNLKTGIYRPHLGLLEMGLEFDRLNFDGPEMVTTDLFFKNVIYRQLTAYILEYNRLKT